MQSSNCSSSGHRIEATVNFCGRCGAATTKPLPYLISVPRVATMSVLSGGLYFYWWLYITWKHYRDHTGEEEYPVWHALTLLVPIYGLFRVHAHTRTFRELMVARQLASTISPVTAVVAALIAGVFGSVGITDVWSGEISESLAIFMLVGGVISTALIAWLLASVQGNVNRFWRAVSPNASSCRLGVGEVLLTILGIAFWGDTIATAFVESWRTL